MFLIGNRLGEAVMDPRRYRWLPKDQIMVGRRWLQRWGFGLIVANRFLSGTRSVISMVAGMAHMKTRGVIISATISALVWTSLIAWGGYILGDNWEVVGEYLAAYGKIMLWLVGGFVLAYVAWRFFRRHEVKVQTDTTETSEVEVTNTRGDSL